MEITTARYINVNGSLLDLSQPRVMGILNVTPDSFYAGSRTQTDLQSLLRAFLPVGGQSIASLRFLRSAACFCAFCRNGGG